jgi:hypothetical protein
MSPKVLSITPALPGWFSEYRQDGGTIEMRVALWALVEKVGEDGKTYTYPTSFSVGEGPGTMEAEPDDETENFVGYAYREPPSSPLHLDATGKPMT